MRRFVIGFGCVVVATLSLYPPTYNPQDVTRARGREYLFSRFVTADGLPPSRVDAGRLLAECVFVTALIGALLCFIGPKGETADGRPTPPQDR
jgi:hypothetical protein